MRNKRQEAILTLITEKNIETQQDLTIALASVGFDVTQATVSRDIKELGLIKEKGKVLNHRYAMPINNTINNIAKIPNNIYIPPILYYFLFGT